MQHVSGQLSGVNVDYRLRERALSSADIYEMRVMMLRDGVSVERVARKWRVSADFVADVKTYRVRDESAACPDSSRWSVRSAGSMYAATVAGKSRRHRRPFLSYDQVKQIRIKKLAGEIRLDDASLEDAAFEYGVSVDSMRAILEGELFNRPECYPSNRDLEAYGVAH